MNREWLEERIAKYPICEYAFIDPKELSFLEEVRYICRTECPQYGKSWSCPPAVGTVEECRKRCEKYTGGFLFTTMSEADLMGDMEEALKTRAEHEKITQRVRDLVCEGCEDVLVLSTESCAICETCAYPGQACRHPDLMFPCIESYGILVTELSERYGIQFISEAGVVTWFSLILYC